MVINHTFEEQLRKLISESQDELHSIEAEMSNLEKRRNTIADELQSYEASLRNYLRRMGQEPEEKTLDWDKLLGKCKNHKEKLIVMAKQNNGQIKLSPTVDILYNGKFIKSRARANAYQIVYGLINDMVDKGIFEKADRGTYRLTQSKKLL